MLRTNKLLLMLVTLIAILSLSSIGVFAESDNDGTYSRLAELLTSFNSLQSQLGRNNAKIQKVTERLGELQSLEENAATQRKIKKVEGRTAALNKKSTALEQEITNRAQEIENLRAQLQNGEDVRSWHKRAKAQVIAWNFKQSARTLTITLLDKKTGKSSIKAAKFRVRDGEKFYLADKLPEGLQAVVPEGWTVNLDSRTAGFAAKISDPENIASSTLDSESNVDSNNTKTFTSGEAFIILKHGAMIIRPAEESDSSAELNSESESITTMQNDSVPEEPQTESFEYDDAI